MYFYYLMQTTIRITDSVQSERLTNRMIAQKLSN